MADRFVRAVSAVVDSVTDEVGSDAELSLSALELLTRMFCGHNTRFRSNIVAQHWISSEPPINCNKTLRLHDFSALALSNNRKSSSDDNI